MAAMVLTVNDKQYTVDASPQTPLLWVLRDTLGLTGTKFGCSKGLCGSCTVHLDGAAVRSCLTPLSAVGTRRITTIEGLSADGKHPLQQAWLAERVPQCGYCQPGHIMAAAALLAASAKPTDAEIDAALRGHVCRCGTYSRIRRAIRRAAQKGIG